MKHLLIIAATLFASNITIAAQMKVDTSHSELGYSVSHLVISTHKGQFKKFSGNFDFNEKTKTLKNAVIEIDMASVSSGDEGRDKHLKNDDFFDVPSYPKATLTVKEAKIGKETTASLKLKDITKDVKITINYKGKIKNAWGKDVYAFDASSKFDRKDFGIEWNKPLEKAGGLTVGNDVTINATIQANPAETKKKK